MLPAAATASAHRPGLHPGQLFVGTAGPDVIHGRGGPDTIFGFGGDDQLFGNRGPDRIFAGQGADQLSGGLGGDLLRGGSGPDRMRGGPGNDLLLAAGDGSVDTVSCGAGRQDLAIVEPTDVVAPGCEIIWVRDPEA
jgi:Ca2+-binding RTX toxin-like protein